MQLEMDRAGPIRRGLNYKKSLDAEFMGTVSGQGVFRSRARNEAKRLFVWVNPK